MKASSLSAGIGSAAVAFGCAVASLEGAAVTVGPLVGDAGATVSEDATVLAANPGGTVTVESGIAAFTTGDEMLEAELPASLRKGLSLWLDANVNAVWGSNLTESGETKEGIVEWRDVRETGTDSSTFAYPRAVVNVREDDNYSDLRSTPPTYFDDTNNVFAGKKLIDFGEFGSKQWLYAANRSGGQLRVPCQSFFIVGGLHGTHGHILADVEAVNTFTGNSTMFYHKASGGSGDGALASSSLDSCVMPLGETRLNGVTVNPIGTTLTRNAFWLLTQNGPGVVSRGGVPVRPFFTTLFNHGNYTKRRGYGADRQGGGILGEVLIYDRVLSDAERRQVEAYLNAKWFRKPTLGSVRVAAAGTAYVAAGLGIVYAGSFGGTGAVDMGASGLYVNDDRRLDEASYGMSSFGSTVFDQKRTEHYVRIQSGKTLILRTGDGLINRGADRSGVTRLVGGNSGCKAMVDPDAIHGQYLQVTNVTVILAPHATIPTETATPETPFWEGTNLIANGGFESQQPGTTGFTKLNTTTASKWTVSGDSDCAYAAGYNSVWYQNGGSYVATNHFGNCVGAMQGDASQTVAISQKVVPPVTGQYRLSYYLSRRQSRTADTGANAPVLKVSIDGVAFHRNCVFDNKNCNYNEMNPYSTLTPVLEKDREYTISFAVDDNSTADRAIVLDEIRLTPAVTGTDLIFIPGYDMLATRTAIPGMGASVGNYVYSIAGTFWEPVTEEEVYGQSMNSTWWTYADAQSGEEALDRRSIYLQKDAAVTNTVYFPRAGRVRFSVRYGNRSASYGSATPFDDTTRPSGQTFEVRVGGEVIGAVPVMSAKMSTAEFEFDVAAAGYRELRLSSIRTTALAKKDCTTVFNSPAMEYVASDSKLEVAQSVDIDVVAPSNGFYALSLPLSGQKIQPCVTNGVMYGYKTYPAIATVSVDGKWLAQLRSQNDSIEPYELRLPYLTAGAHTVSLLADVHERRHLRYQTPTLKPLSLAAFDRDATENDTVKTVISLEAGATLDLRYEGSYRISKLIRNGETIRGTVTAELYPDWVTGPGALEMRTHGMMILVR